MHDQGSGPLFTCEHCGKTFKNNSTMWAHRQTAHGKATFHCDKCGDTFKLEKHMKNHFERKHSSGNFVCDQCGKTYTNPLSLKDHKSEVHNRVNPVKCTFEGCHEVLQNSNMKRFEIEIETNIFPFIISKPKRYRNRFSGYFLTNTDSISIFSRNFDIKTNNGFETN